MTKEFKLQMISMPNFINYEMPPVKRQDGFKPEGNAIPVGSLSEDEAKEYAEEMKEAFLSHWAKKSKE